MDEQREVLLQQENRVNVSGCGGNHDPSNGQGNVTIALFPMYHNIMESTGLVGDGAWPHVRNTTIQKNKQIVKYRKFWTLQLRYLDKKRWVL